LTKSAAPVEGPGCGCCGPPCSLRAVGGNLCFPHFFRARALPLSKSPYDKVKLLASGTLTQFSPTMGGRIGQFYAFLQSGLSGTKCQPIVTLTFHACSAKLTSLALMSLRTAEKMARPARQGTIMHRITARCLRQTTNVSFVFSAFDLPILAIIRRSIPLALFSNLNLNPKPNNSKWKS